MKVHKWLVCFFIVTFPSMLLTLVFAIGVARSEYPERPITVLVGMQAGGPLDLGTRAISTGAEKVLGQPLVIENRTAGSGTAAATAVAAARPDGYRLFGTSAVQIIRVPQFLKVTTFKPLRSFTPIVGYATPINGLVVRKDAPWQSLPELVDYAKKNPGKIKYTGSTVGSAFHHAMEYIAFKAGIKWVHIPQTGAGPAMIALLGGHVDACSAGADFVPHAKSETVRVLAIYDEKRSPFFPDVPTLKELGYDFVNEQVFCILGPAGLPPEIVKKLETAFAKGMESPEFKTFAEKLYLAPSYYNSQDFGRFLEEQWFKIEKSLKETGMMKEPATPPY